MRTLCLYIQRGKKFEQKKFREWEEMRDVYTVDGLGEEIRAPVTYIRIVVRGRGKGYVYIGFSKTANHPPRGAGRR